MRDATFFTHPKGDWQRRYEALRASFVDRLSASAIADRFGYKPTLPRTQQRQCWNHGGICTTGRLAC